jgi:hypothetical protein
LLTAVQSATFAVSFDFTVTGFAAAARPLIRTV